MTDRCEPPEHLRGVDGWHWVHHRAASPEIFKWWAPIVDARGEWVIRAGGLPERMAERGYRYLAPVATPEEVEAMRAERDEAWKFQGEAHRLRTGNKLLADTVRAWGWENRKQESNGELIGRALHEMHAEITTLRARVETLEAALISKGGTTSGVMPRLASASTESAARAALEGKP